MRREEGARLMLRLLIMAAAGAAVLAFAGCGMKKEAERERMLSYIKEKYGEEFEFVEDYAGQAGKDYRMIVASDRRNPDRRVLVRFIREGGEGCFADNYPAFLLRKELEEKIGALAGSCFGVCKVFYKIPEFVFPAEYGQDMTADEFLKDSRSMAQFYIYPKETRGEKREWEERLDIFGKMNAANGWQIRGTLSLARERKDYEMITQENFAGSVYEGYEAVAELVFSMDENGGFRYRRWIDGGNPEKGSDR